MTKNKATDDAGAMRLSSSGESTMVVNITDSAFTKNKTTVGEGGAIEADTYQDSELTLNITDTLFEGNQAKTSGGAVDTETSAAGTLNHTTTRDRFDKNKARTDGGAIQGEANDNGTLTTTLTNSVFVGNKAGDDGGALSIEANDLAEVTFSSPNSTFTLNQAKDQGGAIRLVRGTGTLTATIKNDIIRGNTAAAGDDVLLSGSPAVTVSFSNFGDISGAFTDGGGNLDVDPLLVNPAAGDVHLQAGSPMIDAGTCTGAPATDFEGDARPTGAGCDIGADESV
jgi:predicted outer membrane repeat protein